MLMLAKVIAAMLVGVGMVPSAPAPAVAQANAAVAPPSVVYTAL